MAQARKTKKQSSTKKRTEATPATEPSIASRSAPPSAPPFEGARLEWVPHQRVLCPQCGSGLITIARSRGAGVIEGHYARDMLCRKCGYRFGTYEPLKNFK